MNMNVNTKNTNATNAKKNMQRPEHYCTYLDCLRGRAFIPHDPLGKQVFQLLMVGGMVTFMVIHNGISHSGLAFLPHGLWMLPIVFCVAFLVRTFVANPLVGRLAGPLVISKFQGTARGVGMTLLNVCIMAPIMCSFVTLLLHGVVGYVPTLLDTLPHTLLTALCVNFFIVGPIVKMVYNDLLTREGTAHVLNRIQKYVMPWAYFLND